MFFPTLHLNWSMLSIPKRPSSAVKTPCLSDLPQEVAQLHQVMLGIAADFFWSCLQFGQT